MFNKVLKSRIAMVALAAIILILGSVAVSVIMGNYQDKAEARSSTATFEPAQKDLAVKAAMVTEKQQVAQAAPTSIIVNLPTVTPTPVAVAMVPEQPQAQPVQVAAAPASAVQSVLPAPAVAVQPQVQPIGVPASSPGMTVAQAQAVLAEVDAEVTIDDRTPGYRDVRFGVTKLGQNATGSVIFNIDQSDSWTGRIVCDDDCTGFYLVKSDGNVFPLLYQKFYPHDFNYASLSANEQQLAADYGINIVDGEILGQYLFTTPVAVARGDKLIIAGNDDPLEGVNRGFFFSWRFVIGQEVQVGPLNK